MLYTIPIRYLAPAAATDTRDSMSRQGVGRDKAPLANKLITGVSENKRGWEREEEL
jgi:hypothetical protein